MLLPKTFLTLSNSKTFFAKQEKYSFIFAEKSPENQKIKSPKSVKDLQEIRESFSGTAAAIFFENDMMRSALSGEMLLALRRNNKIHPLADSKNEQVLSGKILPGDEFILCPKKSFEESPLRLANQANALFIKFEEKNKDLNINNPRKINLPFKKIMFIVTSFFQKINLKILKIGIAIITLLIVFFVIFNFASGVAKGAKEKIAVEVKKIEDIKNKFEQAEELLNLNNVRSREIAENTLSEINKIDLKSITSSENQKKLGSLKKSLEKIITDSSNIVKSKAVKVYSTTLLKKNSTASKMSSVGNQISILDLKQNLVYSVNLSSKKAEIFDLDKYTKSSKLITSTPDYIYIFSSKSIVQIDLANGKIQTVIQNPSDWKNIVAIAEYSENIYLLDSSNNQIWKNVKDDSGFAATKTYFEIGKAPEDSKSFAIDSAVYVISEKTVAKFLSGEKENFSLDKIPNSPLKNPLKVITSSDFNNLYLLEPTEKRIVIFDKKGKYVKQIVDNRLEFANDFGINEKDKEIYFPQGADIYKISF